MQRGGKARRARRGSPPTKGKNGDGRREVLGLAIGTSEAETFWTDFLRKLARRGLRGVKLVVSDAHEGLKAAIARVLNSSWQRCRVHFMRNALAHAGKQGRRVVSAFIGTAFAQDDAEAARSQWRQVADRHVGTIWTIPNSAATASYARLDAQGCFRGIVSQALTRIPRMIPRFAV